MSLTAFAVRRWQATLVAFLLFTVVAVVVGSLLPDAHIAALTATGGLLLVGVGLRLLRVREIPVGDLLPALLVAPLLTQLVVLLR